jgi:hypothetical protein
MKTSEGNLLPFNLNGFHNAPSRPPAALTRKPIIEFIAWQMMMAKRPTSRPFGRPLAGFLSVFRR